MIPEISSPDISLLASLVCRTTRHCESVTNLSSLHSQCCYCKRWTAQCWFIFIKLCQTKESEIPSTLQFYKRSVCHIFGEGNCTPWCFQTGEVLEKTLQSALNCKESKPVNPKGNQPWIFIGRTAAEAPILWPPGAKRPWCLERLKEKTAAEDEMHHQLSEHEFEQTPGDSGRQRSLACSSP